MTGPTFHHPFLPEELEKRAAEIVQHGYRFLEYQYTHPGAWGIDVYMGDNPKDARLLYIAKSDESFHAVWEDALRFAEIDWEEHWKPVALEDLIASLNA